VVSMLDKHVALLEKKVKSAYHISSTQWFPSTNHYGLRSFFCRHLSLSKEHIIFWMNEQTAL
jgi:hypothetical protein